MKMTYIPITVLAYFLTDTLNWQVLWSIKYFYGKLKNDVSLKQM